MFNVKNWKLNDFKFVEGQDQLLKDLYTWSSKMEESFISPIIFANGKANMMVTSNVFASFLILGKIMDEKKVQVETKPNGCVDIT